MSVPCNRSEAQREATAARVAAAIEGLLAEGSAVSVYSVAERAQVARSTLYRRPDLKAAVEEARAASAAEPMRVGEQVGLVREVAELRRKVDELSALLPSTSYQCVAL